MPLQGDARSLDYGSYCNFHAYKTTGINAVLLKTIGTATRNGGNEKEPPNVTESAHARPFRVLPELWLNAEPIYHLKPTC